MTTDSLFTMPKNVQTRWASPENWDGAKGAAGQARNGRKGSASFCFRPAQSALDGRTLLVWHDQIEAPVAVRYAWADNPAAANLMNTEGEPAAPFCTQGEIHT
jgi:hypothetical protein